MKLPEKVKIIEVGPRDGFQNIATFIETEDKVSIIGLLKESGIQGMEVTSFVHPKAIPQMKDAKNVVEETLKSGEDYRHIALVPNARGAKNAYESGIKEVSYVISASAEHNLANVNRSIEDSVEELVNIMQSVPQLKIRLDIATAFGCPYMGKVPYENVCYLIEKAIELDIEEVVLCDTIGIANPLQVSELSSLVQAKYPHLYVTLHLHNTRGQGLANILAAMEQGICAFETSVGGLGGCPFAPGAAGNVATEDLVNMLDYMGIETGIDQDKLLKAVAFVERTVEAKLTGNMLNACKYENI